MAVVVMKGSSGVLLIIVSEDFVDCLQSPQASVVIVLWNR